MNSKNNQPEKRDDEEIRRLNRTLKALSHSNRALLRAANEQWYLQEVCKIIVGDCGHAMTWIGFAEDDEKKTVRPVAHAGFEDGYLETLNVTWADTERGRGPTGIAIRTGKPSFCRNMLTDPNFAPWREEALLRGYASSLVLPLSDEEKTFGALTIYFKDPDPFTESEVKLLSDLADDLAYGIKSIRLAEAHKKAEREREISEAKANALIKYAPTAIYEIDYKQRRFISVNDAMSRMLGYTKEELLSMDPSSILDAGSQVRFADRIKDHLAGKKISDSVEYRARKKDGTMMDGILNVSLNLSPDVPNTALVVAYDISERKKAEAVVAEISSALKHERDILQAVMDGAKAFHLVYLDRGFNFVRVNQAYANTCGYQPEEMVGKNHFVLYPNAENEAIFRRVRDTGEPAVYHDKPFEFPDQPERGVTYWDWTLTPVKDRTGKVEGLIFSLFDTTERVRREQILKESEEKIRRAAQRWQITFDSIPDLVSIQDRDFKLIDINKSFGRIYNKSIDELKGKKCFEVFHQTNCEMKTCPHERTMRTKGVASEVIYEPAVNLYLEATTSPLFDESGELLGTVHVAKDITQRKKADAEIKKYEEHLEELVTEQTEQTKKANAYNRSLIEASLDPLVTISTEGKITDANAATEIATGRNKDELMGTDFSEYFTEPEKARSAYEQVFREGHIVDYPLDILHKDGHLTPVLYNATVYRDVDGKVAGVFAAARDISERRSVETALWRRAEEQAVVADLGQHALKGTTLDVLMDAVVAFVARTLGVEHCKILELLPDGRQFLLQAGVGWKPGYVRKARVDAGRNSQSGYTLLSREPVITEDIHTEARFECPALLQEHNITSGITVVIGERGKPFGVLGAHSTEKRAFTEDDSVFLQAVANVLAQAIERKRAEDAVKSANEYNRSLLEASLDPLVTISPEGKITDVNAATEKATGRKREDLVGTDFSSYFTEPDNAKAGYEQVFREGVVTDYPLEIKRADGHVTPVLYNAAMYRNQEGKVTGVFAAARDITDRKRAEDEIRKLNAELEARVKERTEQLEIANKELEAFSYSVSHDLRAPLRTVDGFSLALLEDYSTQLDTKAVDYLNRLRGASQSMGVLIDDLLELSRVTRHEIRPEKINLSKMAEEIVSDLRQGEPGRAVTIEIAPGLVASGDPRLIRIVLQNLIGNSWKFTGRRSHAKIEINSSVVSGKRVFFVKDNGAGFNPKYIDKLFVPFQRLHSPKEFPGTGIGLATTQRIIKRHGGVVWADGELEKGATFYFTLEKEDIS